MKEAFKRVTVSMICSSIIAFILGLIMVIYPGLSMVTMGIIVGIYMIIHGVVLVALDFKSNMNYSPFDGIVSGILFIILGILLIAMPGILSLALTLALGVWIILTSVGTIRLALVIKGKNSNWVLILLFGILDLVAGILILFNPFASSISITVLSGAIIMAHSVINIIDMIIIKKNIKSFTDAVENSKKKNQA